MVYNAAGGSTPTTAETTRRRFLAGTAGLAGAAVAVHALRPVRAAADGSSLSPGITDGSAGQPTSPDTIQGVTDARLTGNDFFLSLDGQTGFALQEVDGGVIAGAVVVEKVGPDHIVRKHIAGVKYEDLTVSFGFDQPLPVYVTIQDTLIGSRPRRNGAVIGADFNHSELSRLSFSDALISEVSFPALDASSKDPAKISVKLSPEFTRTKATPGGGPIITPSPGTKQKQWLPANFRLHIDGLDEPCSRVNKIEALVVKQKVVEHAVGQPPTFDKEATTIEFPNLIITMPESVAKPFYDWHQDFVIGGNNGPTQTRGGTLTYLAPDGTPLGQLVLFQLGIIQVTHDVAAGTENIRRVKAEMYCERMEFQVNSQGLQ